MRKRVGGGGDIGMQRMRFRATTYLSFSSIPLVKCFEIR